MEKIREIGITRLARAIGVTHGAIVNWFTRGRIPAEQVLPIVRAGLGNITPYELRPDIYPDPAWMPPDMPSYLTPSPHPPRVDCP